MGLFDRKKNIPVLDVTEDLVSDLVVNQSSELIGIMKEEGVRDTVQLEEEAYIFATALGILAIHNSTFSEDQRRLLIDGFTMDSASRKLDLKDLVSKAHAKADTLSHGVAKTSQSPDAFLAQSFIEKFVKTGPDNLEVAHALLEITGRIALKMRPTVDFFNEMSKKYDLVAK